MPHRGEKNNGPLPSPTGQTLEQVLRWVWEGAVPLGQTDPGLWRRKRSFRVTEGSTEPTLSNMAALNRNKKGPE